MNDITQVYIGVLNSMKYCFEQLQVGSQLSRPTVQNHCLKPSHQAYVKIGYGKLIWLTRCLLKLSYQVERRQSLTEGKICG